MKQIYYATGNQCKFEMVCNYLKQHVPNLELKQVKIDLIEGQGIDLEKISVSKAKQAWQLLGAPVLVDDSGVFFKKYHQFPGVMTKFVYQGLGFDGIY